MANQDLFYKRLYTFINKLSKKETAESICQKIVQSFQKSSQLSEPTLETLKEQKKGAEEYIAWIDKELNTLNSTPEVDQSSTSEEPPIVDDGATKNGVTKDAGTFAATTLNTDIIEPTSCSPQVKKVSFPEASVSVIDFPIKACTTKYSSTYKYAKPKLTNEHVTYSKAYGSPNTQESLNTTALRVSTDQRKTEPENTEKEIVMVASNKGFGSECTDNPEKNASQSKLTIPAGNAATSSTMQIPQDLWQDIVTKESETSYYKSDKDHSCIAGNAGLRLIAASVRGRSHAHVGSPRDDDFYIHCSEVSGWNILAVADGAGSCKFSRKGSQIAAKESVMALDEKLQSETGSALLANYPKTEEEKTDQEILKKLQNSLYETLVKSAYKACEAINEQATKDKESAKDFSTTLLLAAHKKTKFGHFIISFWVGDGAIALYKAGDKVELLGEPDGGEYAGQTRFLDERIFTDSSVMKRARIKLVDDFTALILATDGITDPNFNSDADLAEVLAWDEIWNTAKWNEEPLKEVVTAADSQSAEERLVKWAEFYSSGNHDDRTIAVLTSATDDSNE